jgi:hypothetical protein
VERLIRSERRAKCTVLAKWVFAIFAQNHAVSVSEIVRKIRAIVSALPSQRVFGNADRS